MRCDGRRQRWAPAQADSVGAADEGIGELLRREGVGAACMMR
jgi:hypothetical protein